MPVWCRLYHFMRRRFPRVTNCPAASMTSPTMRGRSCRWCCASSRRPRIKSSRSIEESPVSNFNTSKGKIYPLIRRLEQAGLIAKRRIDGRRRGTEELRCTAGARRRCRNGSCKIRAEHLPAGRPAAHQGAVVRPADPEERSRGSSRSRSSCIPSSPSSRTIARRSTFRSRTSSTTMPSVRSGRAWTGSTACTSI